MSVQQRNIQSYIFGAILILLFIAMLRLFAPIFTVLLWSTLLYIILSPLHRRVIRNLNFETVKGKILRNVWAAVFTMGTILIILFPLSFVISIFIMQILEMVRYLLDLLSERPEYLRDIFEKLSSLIRDVSAGQIQITADDIRQQIINFLNTQLQRMPQIGGGIQVYWRFFNKYVVNGIYNVFPFC